MLLEELPGLPKVMLVVGGVLSMLMLATFALAWFPALSKHVPLTDWCAPSLDRMTGLVTKPTPERESEHLKVTVTFPLFQPKLSGTGEAEPVTVGAVLSMLMFPILREAVLPALSAQEAVLDWLNPSFETG